MSAVVTPADALQRVLKAEHAAVSLYASLGAQTSASARPDDYAVLESAYRAHRDSRDELTQRLHDLGAEPVAALPAYEFPEALTIGSVRQYAASIEDDCSATYAYAIAHTNSADRAAMLAGLKACTRRTTAFGNNPRHFPGLSEYADR